MAGHPRDVDAFALIVSTRVVDGAAVDSTMINPMCDRREGIHDRLSPI